MGGYKVSDSTEKLIVTTWLDLRKNGRESSAPKVKSAIEEYIRSSKRDDIFLPSLRKIEEIIKEAKERLGQFSPEQALQQQHWTMATLEDYELPVESLPHVMQIWRYCCHTDEEFTIRQAKWVSRLWHIPLDPLSTDELWSLSYMYARKEELCLISDKNHDTLLEDVNLVMGGLEPYTFLALNYGPSITDPFGLGLPINRKDHSLIEEAAHPIEYFNAIQNGLISNERDKQLINRCINSGALPRLELTQDNKMMYLSWFTHIRKSQEWPRITADQALDVILALRKWSEIQQSIQGIAEKPIQVKVTRTTDKAHVLTFGDAIPRPEEALKLLSQYAEKEGGK
jgi:hypothetical protein